MEGEKVAKIQNFYTKYSRMPSFRELSELFGFKSKNAAWKFAKKLEDAGLARKGKDGRLVPGPALTETKILGGVSAGFPSPAEEELVDTMSLDEYLIENREATYILKVEGESMKDAGIRPDDLVLVERVTRAKLGQIVVARVDGEFTMKYLRRENQRYYLEPANEAYENIHPEGDLEIVGVVRGVVRKYS